MFHNQPGCIILFVLFLQTSWSSWATQSCAHSTYQLTTSKWLQMRLVATPSISSSSQSQLNSTLFITFHLNNCYKYCINIRKEHLFWNIWVSHDVVMPWPREGSSGLDSASRTWPPRRLTAWSWTESVSCRRWLWSLQNWCMSNRVPPMHTIWAEMWIN